MWQHIFAVVVLTALVPATGAIAQTWPPPAPEGGDGRVYVDGKSLSEDRVTVVVPYNYAQNADHEWLFLEAWANWACSLYKRKAVPVSLGVSDPACDEIGSAAAERSSECWHEYEFACGIPPGG